MQVHFVAGRAFDEVNVRDGITSFDHVEGCLVEGSKNGFVEC